jgi:hypothetical protein
MPKTLATSYTLSDKALRDVIGELQGAAVDQIFNSAGLAIGSSSKAKAKIVNTIYALVNGVLVTKTTAEITLSGTILTATYNVYVLTMASDGTVTATMGTAGATLAAVVFPAIPADSAVIGFVIVHPTGTGSFVGGTTELDDATVVPNAVYVNTVGSFNPNLLAL